MLVARKILLSGCLLISLVSVASISVAQELDSTANILLDQVRDFTWQPVDKAAKSLRYEDVVKETPDSDKVELAKLKIDEARAEAQKLRAENSFLFALIAPKYLEDAGVDQVEATRLQAEATLQQALLDNSGRYFELMTAQMMQLAAYYRLLAIEEQLRLDESRFKLGEVTSMAVIQSQNALLEGYQDFEKSGEALAALSLALGQVLDEDHTVSLQPQELQLTAIESRFVLFSKPPQVVLPEKSQEKMEEKLARLAKAQQPDFKALLHQRDALKHLLGGSWNRNDPQHKVLKAQLGQAELLIEQAEDALAAQLHKTMQDREQAARNLQVAQARLTLAQKALHHVRVSHKSGFSNNKDVLDAESALVLAQVGLGQAQLAIVRTDLALLRAVGLLKPELLLGDQPIVIDPDKVQI